MNNSVWPDHYNLDETPEIKQKFQELIDGQLTALKNLDEQRKDWVKNNLPSDYQLTYLFHDHTLRVAEDVKQTVLQMGLSELAAQNMYDAMLLHDCGKSQLPLHLWDMVDKPEDHIKSERRRHTEIGADIIRTELKDVEHPHKDLILDVILHHHEQMDGQGHLGIKGDKLSKPVRLACIVESFDGYSIPRPHFGNRDVSVPGVLARMRDEKGAKLYDMELFETFAQMKISRYKEASNG